MSTDEIRSLVAATRAVAKAERERDEARAALGRVERLHRKVTVYGECSKAFGCESIHCTETSDGNWVHDDDPVMETCDQCWDSEEGEPEWPCPTVTAIRGDAP